jgi:predicted MarR family transcription regulator
MHETLDISGIKGAGTQAEVAEVAEVEFNFIFSSSLLNNFFYSMLSASKNADLSNIVNLILCILSFLFHNQSDQFILLTTVGYHFLEYSTLYFE